MNTKIFINGRWLGYSNIPKNIVNSFKEKRDLNIINKKASIYWDIENNEIYIYTDRGRCTRPLLKNNIKDIDIDYLKYNNWNNYILIIIL